ncbi:SDR family oxidoreductase [Halorubrum rutilum]|uniref:SDR family oxidoreductase n=1 Tax=Halorubrum rutilum TaxID=1364933 RepID=A0ABD6ANB7_9EURY|nr:SDR family oxidoreductase [Halorubrum rutilum]
MEPTVAITGATSGIGRAVAEAFVEAGAFVAVSGRDGDAVDRTVAELNGEDGDGDDGDGSSDGPGDGAGDAESAGDAADADDADDAPDAPDTAGTAWGERVDVRDEFDLERFFQRAAREGGPIDVVLANAAVFHGAPGGRPTDEVSYADYDDTMRTNARGVFATIGEAVPHLADGARVIVPSGSVAHESTPGMGAYAVSKAAAEAVARGFAADLDAAVGVVDPGLVATDLTGKERARDPESVAPLFVWAATEAPAEDLNGERLGLREWKSATR